MSTFLPLFVAVVIGVGSSAQIALIGGMARGRGAPDAVFTSMMATLAGIGLVLAIRGFRGEPPLYAAPLNSGGAFLLVAAVATVMLVLSMKGLHPGYAVTGLFATAFLLGTAVLVPRLGVTLFFAATTAGSLIGALIFDQIGAFGAQPAGLSPLRIIGVLAVCAGVVLVRVGR